MKIIYLTHWRFPSEKTMSPLVLRTCEGFVREGFDCELWVPKRVNPEFAGVDPFLHHGIKARFPIRRLRAIDLIPYIGSFGFLLMVASFNLSCFFRLIRLRGRKDVVIYAHDLRDLILPCLLGFPLFSEIHDFYESRWRILNRFVLNRVSGLVSTNRIKIRRLTQAYGFPEARMIFQPNAVNTAFFDIPLERREARKQLGFPREGTILLYAGHLFGWKGIYTLAEAARFLPESAVVYFVGGTQKDRSALESFVEKEHLPRIRFIGHQPHEMIPIYMKAADILVLPNTAKEEASRYETSPVKLFEYLASMRPVVASDLPALREVVSEREVAFFEADNAESLARAIAGVLLDPEAASVRARAAFETAKGHSWEARAKHIADFIRVSV